MTFRVVPKLLITFSAVCLICSEFLNLTTDKMALPAAMALSGLNEEYFSDGLNDVFNQGAVLLKTPSSASLTSSEGGYSQESGISSMSSETSIARNLAPYFDLLYKTHIELKDEDNQKYVQNTQKVYNKEIIYEKRNILDLAANIKWNNWKFQPAVMRPGIQYFFENRSQYSRVLGAHIPEHEMVPCPAQGCSFKEPRYA